MIINKVHMKYCINTLCEQATLKNYQQCDVWRETSLEIIIMKKSRLPVQHHLELVDAVRPYRRVGLLHRI